MRLWRVPYPKFGNGPALERITRIADRLGISLSDFGSTAAGVVGSNGKGSTAAMTSALLTQAGANVGLFTSPHLFELNERFRVGDDDISDEELSQHWERVGAAAEVAGEAQNLGGFEFLFLIAADWFSARACSHTVWEAGIGGRFDPLRLIEAQRVALTALDLEHTELLGATLEEIARDKIDAAPSGGKLFVGESCAPMAEAITAHCRARAVTCSFVNTDLSAAPPLYGAFQANNAALAVALAQDLLPMLSTLQIEAGFAGTRWPGRLETIDDAPLTIIDVGHTPDAIQRALQGFKVLSGERAALLVCGASKDKNPAAIIAALAPEFSTIICAAARHKGAPAAEIAAHANVANPQAEIAIADSVTDAYRLARTKTPLEGAIYVAGGLFLAAEFKAVHVGRDPALLAFF